MSGCLNPSRLSTSGSSGSRSTVFFFSRAYVAALKLFRLAEANGLQDGPCPCKLKPPLSGDLLQVEVSHKEFLHVYTCREKEKEIPLSQSILAKLIRRCVGLSRVWEPCAFRSPPRPRRATPSCRSQGLAGKTSRRRSQISDEKRRCEPARLSHKPFGVLHFGQTLIDREASVVVLRCAATASFAFVSAAPVSSPSLL